MLAIGYCCGDVVAGQRLRTGRSARAYAKAGLGRKDFFLDLSTSATRPTALLLTRHIMANGNLDSEAERKSVPFDYD